jgi:hypothetical protein
MTMAVSAILYIEATITGPRGTRYVRLRAVRAHHGHGWAIEGTADRKPLNLDPGDVLAFDTAELERWAAE